MKNKKIWIIGMVIGLIIIFIVFYLNQGLDIPPGEFKLMNSCEQDSDCVWAFRPNECCNCPSIYNEKIVNADRGLVVYEKGKDYSSLRTNKCVDINCATCGPIRELKCVNNKCILAEK